MLFKALPIMLGVLWLSLVSQVVFAHGMSAEEKAFIVDGGNMAYLWIGATHMLSGYDHLAFVFGVIFFLRTFKAIIQYVTAFTVGHSITLIYATIQGVQLNYLLIDAVIALSVCYIAFANLDGFRKYLLVNPPNMLMMITGFGLIHGFGLSTRLQELPLSTDNLLMNIVSFNIGIELGQITALVLMLLLIAAWRKRDSFKAFSLMANYSLMVAGALLFIMQMHDFTHEREQNPPTTYEVVQTTVSNAGQPRQQDSLSIVIPARGEIEYKVLLDKGASMEYTWKNQGEKLFFDFHGDPKGDTTGYFESYATGTESQFSGSFVAPFTGKHGWYWKNSSQQVVHVALNISGVYSLMPNQEETLADKAEKMPEQVPENGANTSGHDNL